MNTLALELSLEQQFSLYQYENQVKKLSSQETQKLLIDVLRQLMVKDNVIRSLIRFGIG
jgi:Phycobilisome degradation protein nblA